MFFLNPFFFDGAFLTGAFVLEIKAARVKAYEFSRLYCQKWSVIVPGSYSWTVRWQFLPSNREGARHKQTQNRILSQTFPAYTNESFLLILFIVGLIYSWRIFSCWLKTYLKYLEVKGHWNLLLSLVLNVVADVDVRYEVAWQSWIAILQEIAELHCEK